jgi:hypothetical protein
MSSTSSGKRCSFLRRGRSMMPFTHASQPSSRQAAPPRMWTLTSSWRSFPTRQNVPRRSPSNRLPSAPRCRRARRSTTMAYSSFPSHQTAANGRPSVARNWPPSHPLFQRFIALAMCHLTRDRALRVSARSRDGATVVKTRTHPAQNSVVSFGVRPCFRLWGRSRCRATLACSSARRDAWREPCTSPRLGACPRTSRVRLVSQGCSRNTCMSSTRCPSPSDTGRGAGLIRRRTSAGFLTVSTMGVAEASPRSASAISPGPNGKWTRLAPVCWAVTVRETHCHWTKSIQLCRRSWGPWAPGPWT